MRPTGYDHDEAMKACLKIREKGKEEELWAELRLLNRVMGAFVCNEDYMSADISAAEFLRALEKANE